jgi:cytoskeletal protein RodZ
MRTDHDNGRGGDLEPAADVPEVPQQRAPSTVTIGERIVKARTARGLGVEDLARMTMMRATVIHSIEGDDFRVCGGDCYARGHLRLLAHALQMDLAPLIATFNREYCADEVWQAEPADWVPPARTRRWTSVLGLAALALSALCLVAVLL